MMFWYGYGGGWAFWQVALMWFGMIAFWGLLVWAVYAAVTGLARQRTDPGGSVTAPRILDERLARGEIDADEYRRIRELIQAPRGGGHGGRAAR